MLMVVANGASRPARLVKPRQYSMLIVVAVEQSIPISVVKYGSLILISPSAA
jgi:hypothetical protein